MSSQPTLSPLHSWGVVLVATSTMAVSYVDRQALSALAPTITASLGITDGQFGWVGAIFSLAYLIGAPLSGRWIDRVGARRGLVVSVLAWSAVAAAHALVPGLLVLLMLRMLLGASESPSFPGAAQAVSRALPAHRRSVGFGILFTGSSVGAALSAVAAPALDARYGWRIALLATAVVGLAWVPLWLGVTSGTAARAVLDVAPAPPRQPRVPLREVWRDRDLQRAMIAIFGVAPVGGLVMLFGAKVLVAQHGLTQAQVGTWLWAPPLALDAGCLLAGLAMSQMQARGWLGPQAPPRVLVGLATVLGTAIAGVGLSPSPASTTLCMALGVAGNGAIYTLVTSDLLRRVPASRLAAASGAISGGQSLALIITLPLIGAAVQRTHRYDTVGLALAATFTLGGVAWLMIEPRPPLAEPTAHRG